MEFSASQIAKIVDGNVEGNPDTSVTSFAKIEEAQQNQLTFFANPKYEDYLYSTGASIVIINKAYELKKVVNSCLIRVDDAYIAFAALLDKYQQIIASQVEGIQQPVFISSSASYGQKVFIGAFAYIGENVKLGDNTKIFPQVYLGKNVSIGHNCILHPGVKIYHDCVIGNNVTIHAGTVIGSDGFGYAPQANGSFKKVPQIGNVIIENNVEIGANTTVDRATIGSTIIKEGAKLDNLIQVAHNVEIGSSTVIAAQAGISGSTKIGRNVMIGGQAGLVGHIQIADEAKINAQSGVSKSIKSTGAAVTGSPAYDYSSALRSQALSRNLPEMEKRLKELEELVKSIKETIALNGSPNS